MIEVTPYEPTHYKSLLELYKDKAAYGGNFDANRDEEQRLAATADEGNLCIATLAGVVVGSFMVLDNPHSFWLLRFAVSPDLEEGAEIADRLMAKANEIARIRGHSSIIVYTDPTDQNLNERYQKLGFKKDSEYTCYWRETR